MFTSKTFCLSREDLKVFFANRCEDLPTLFVTHWDRKWLGTPAKWYSCNQNRNRGESFYWGHLWQRQLSKGISHILLCLWDKRLREIPQIRLSGFKLFYTLTKTRKKNILIYFCWYLGLNQECIPVELLLIN